MSSCEEPPSKKFCPEKVNTNFKSKGICNPIKNAYSLTQLKSLQHPSLAHFKINKMIHTSNGNHANTSINKLNKKRKHQTNSNNSLEATAQNMSVHRKQLPIYLVKKDLLKYLKKNDTNILIGETGSGKTTQVPQFLFEEQLLGKGNVVVTQPRRVAAITVATRVAQEAGSQLGDLVGYAVRFDDTCTEKTRIKFATDGMVLREVMLDPLLKKYTWVVLDEAHERTINTDILFGVVKKAQKIRKETGKAPLHILIMSATMNAEKFSQYFDNCPMLMAEGREYELDVKFKNKKQDDYIVSCLSIVLKIHKEAPLEHGILVFLTGQEEIDNACVAMNKMMKRVSYEITSPMKVSPFYASLPHHLQLEVFKPCDPKVRHVIFSTNVAETSVTIPGIRIVVDSGKAKIRTYNPTTGFDVLKVRQISQAQAWQRAGRAGREANGTCYHAYTEAQYQKMTLMPAPEIQSSNLTTVVLQLVTVGISDVMAFDFVDKPRADFLQKAVDDLMLLGAVEKVDGGLKLTATGKKMAAFPLEPQYSKILLMGPKYNCTEEVLTIVAMLSGEKAFVLPTGKRRVAALARHKKLASVDGDHITLLTVYQAFKAAKQNNAWCRDNFLNHRNLVHCSDIRKQLAQLCHKEEVKVMSCGEDTDNVRRCLLTGMFTQVAELQPDRKYQTLCNHDEAQIHPSSVLFSSRSPYLLYTELINSGKAYMHTVSWVLPEWLYEVAPDYFRKRHIKADAALYAK